MNLVCMLLANMWSDIFTLTVPYLKVLILSAEIICFTIWESYSGKAFSHVIVYPG